MTIKEHLLTKLIEECAEIQQIACKAQLFGMQEILRNPDGSPHQKNPNVEPNYVRLIAELNDLEATISEMVLAGMLPADWRDAGAQMRKRLKMRGYMVYAQGLGTLIGLEQFQRKVKASIDPAAPGTDETVKSKWDMENLMPEYLSPKQKKDVERQLEKREGPLCPHGVTEGFQCAQCEGGPLP